jgi:hypothetical protein
MRFTITLFMSLIVGIVSAQAPQGVGYQGVATDSEGIELVNQAISIRASILSGSVNGTEQWQETHDTSTDEFGLFALTIGEGVNTGSGLLSSFADIPWGESTYFLQIEMDATGGMDYSLMGVNQMMSVPYALYAESTNLDYDSIANYLSGDSTFVTNISNGLGGGGCDFDYPEGLDGDLIDVSIGWNSSSTYTVPSGKRLYISKISQYGLAIDGVILSTQVGSGWTFSRPLLSTIIANENQVISKQEPNSYVRLIGILVNAGNTLQAITESSPTYTVPSSSTLVITYIARGTGSFSLTNPSGTGTGVMELSEDFIVAFPIAGGSVIETQNGSFNGYLVDEDYFADCGGSGSGEGGNSNSSDGCSYSFPDGLEGSAFARTLYNNHYTVPVGKRLYLTSISSSMTIDELYGFNPVNFGMTSLIPSGSGNNHGPTITTSLVIINSGQTISSSTNGMTCSGVLINENIGISAINLFLDNPYTVPLGKKLYILNDNSAGFYGAVVNDIYYERTPHFLNSGDIISSPNNMQLNGYLADEDYFADCGGGGSSEGGSVSSLDSLTIVNMINDALSNSVSIGVGDYYGGGVVGHIFQPGDEGYIPGETHGYIFNAPAPYDFLEWGCIDVITGANDFDNGVLNTEQIIQVCQESNYAAKYCNDLEIGPYNDWFLPTSEQFAIISTDVMQEYEIGVGGTWTSVEGFEDSPFFGGYSPGLGAGYAYHNYALTVSLIGDYFNLSWGLKTDQKNVVAFREF